MDNNKKRSWLPIVFIAIGGFLAFGGKLPSSFDFGKWLPIPESVYPNARCILLYQNEELKDNLELAVTLQDASMRQRLESAGVKFRPLDVDQEEAKTYRELKLKLPAVIMVNVEAEKGKAVRMADFTTQKAMLELVEETTGKDVTE